MDVEEELFELNILKDDSLTIYQILLDSLLRRRYGRFKSLLHRALTEKLRRIDIDRVFPHPRNKTLLELAIKEGLTDYVKLLLELGANPNRLNEELGRTPIHLAIESRHHDVLETLLQDERIMPNLRVKNLTALHVAVRKEDLRSVRILLEYNANPNIPDGKGVTPIHRAAMRELGDIVVALLEHSKVPINIDEFKDAEEKTARDRIVEKYPDIILAESTRAGEAIDFDRLMYDLNANEEEQFLFHLKRVDIRHLKNSCIKELLKKAIRRDFRNAVSKLIELGYRLNEEDVEAAVRNGSYDILRYLLKSGKLRVSKKMLLVACQELGVPIRSDVDFVETRMKCLRLLLEICDIDPRVQDELGNTPLHYAARADSPEAVKLLLKAGACIGHLNAVGLPPIENISRELLSEYFDECLDGSKDRTDEYEITFNYHCINPHMPTTSHSNDPSLPDSESLMNHKDTSNSNCYQSEMESLDYISRNQSLKQLLHHPLLSSFLYLKWHRIRFVFFINFILYLFFYLLVNSYIYVITVNDSTGNRGNKTEEDVPPVIIRKTSNSVIWSLTVITLVICFIRKILQFASSPCHYIRKFENWLEIMLIIFTSLLLSGIESPQVSALTTLLSSWELVILIGQHPKMSVHIEMFKTVSLNFMKSFSLHLFLLLAFAFAFYVLFHRDTDNDFPNPWKSLFKTIIMLTGEFEASDVFQDGISSPIFSHIVFVFFVFLISIVLFNLLTGLAVSDTREILSEAELVSLISQTRLLAYTERIVTGHHQFAGRQRLGCFCNFLPSFFNANPFNFLAKRLIFFREDFLPNDIVRVRPYQNNAIFIDGKRLSRNKWTSFNCFELEMNSDIVQKVRNILDGRGVVPENRMFIEELRKINKRLDALENTLTR